MTSGTHLNSKLDINSKVVEHYMSHVKDDLQSAVADFDTYSAVCDDSKLVEFESLFKMAMQEYESVIGSEKSMYARRIADCDNWHDLAILIREAEDQYIQKANKAQRFIRGIGDYESAMILWAGLLPTDSYMSAMTGGVKVMLGAIRQRSAQRERMLSALRRVVDVVADSEHNLQQFRGDQGLRRAAQALYVSMLKMIEACINSLVHEKMSDRFKYAALGERKTTIRKTSKQTVERICEDCDDMQREFNKRVQMLTTAKITETAYAAKAMQEQMTENVEPGIARTEDITKETLLHMRDVKENVANQGSVMLQIRQMLHDCLSNSEWHREAEERRSQTTRLQVMNYQLGLEQVRSLTPTEAPSMAQKKWILWNILGLDPQSCIDAAGLMPRIGRSHGHALAQVLNVFKNTRVQEFLHSASSDAVLVEATLDGEEQSRYTAMSLACSELLDDIAVDFGAAAIYYFCGAHNRPQDPLSGGIGIAKVLIGQILNLPDFHHEIDLTFLDSEWIAALQQGETQALYGLFGRLIRQLRTTLFCLIDGVNLFEGRWKLETMAVISELLRVISSDQETVYFKLFLASPSRRSCIAPLLQAAGKNGLVRLRPLDKDSSVSRAAVRLQIAKGGIRKSPSPARKRT